jgi:hypothetical protein
MYIGYLADPKLSRRRQTDLRTRGKKKEITTTKTKNRMTNDE